jgi:hypothetical protein
MSLLAAAVGIALLRLVAVAALPAENEDPGGGPPGAVDLEPVDAEPVDLELAQPSDEERGLAGHRGEDSAAMAARETEPAELFVEANRRYESGEYGQAVDGYQELIARGVAGAAVYYNLGNALLRDGRLGSAIAAYRRAKVLAPRDEDLDANLRFARDSARDALEPPAPGAIRRTLFFWHYSLSASETIRLAVLASLLVFGALSMQLRRRGSEPLRWIALLAGAVLVAAVGSLACRWALPLRVAVVLPAEVEAFSGTDADTVVRFRLHAGTEVRAVETSGDWVRIVLPDGEQGWIQRDQVELVADLR